jgi:hypothetical protein
MRKRNWKEYNKQLIQRGSLTFLINPKLLNTKQVHLRKNGRPPRIPIIDYDANDGKIHFRLAYRHLKAL